MSHGGKRPGAGRPRVRQGEGPLVQVVLDEASAAGLLRFAEVWALPPSGSGVYTSGVAVRTLLSAYGLDEGVREAVKDWVGRLDDLSLRMGLKAVPEAKSKVKRGRS